jgi:hypothetical protein
MILGAAKLLHIGTTKLIAPFLPYLKCSRIRRVAGLIRKHRERTSNGLAVTFAAAPIFPAGRLSARPETVKSASSRASRNTAASMMTTARQGPFFRAKIVRARRARLSHCVPPWGVLMPASVSKVPHSIHGHGPRMQVYRIPVFATFRSAKPYRCPARARGDLHSPAMTMWMMADNKSRR